MGAKQQRRAALTMPRRQETSRYEAEADHTIPVVSRKAPPLEAQTPRQKALMQSIKANIVSIADGPAGVGKSYVMGAMLADALEEKKTEKIFITRPAMEAGESMGFLPGELDEKFEPFFRPFRDVLHERMGKSQADYAIKIGRIEAIPIAYIRGMTFKDCWVVLDEAQNTTPKQMLLFLTRIGKNCKVLVNGDTMQKDHNGESGLEAAIERLRYVPGIGVTTFTSDDIVRSGLVQTVIERWGQTATYLP
jgi:phosphate starvation-inducible PhoH-like protein